MYKSDEFTCFTLCSSSEINKTLDEISTELGIYTQSFLNKDVFLTKLFEHVSQIIVMDTGLGKDEIVQLLSTMKDDGVSNNIPVLIVSQLENNESLSVAIKEFNVISILGYENWKYQFISLIKYLSQIESKQEIDERVEDEVEALTDPLTDLLSWKSSAKIFKSLVNDYKDSSRPFCMIMFDIDNFSQLNEEYGIDIGDEVLVSMSSIIQKNIRRYDTVLRIDADKFGVFLSGANLEIASTKAESFRYEMELRGHGFDKIKATSSFGVLQYKEGDTLEVLHTEICALVAKAKEKGKNKIEVQTH